MEKDKWFRLHKELDDALENMTDEDWKIWKLKRFDMENIHLLPASKQEYQVKEGGLFINDTRKHSWGKLEALICERVTQHGHSWNGTGIRTDICHLYITSNEEIKEGDWYLDTTVNVIFKNDKLFLNGTGYKKIILTTDQDLIADGVQAIDDEFLEWFVKNPSCEEVKVMKDTFFESVNYHFYKIIIPQEKPKQETLEEAAERTYQKGLQDDIDLSFYDGVRLGAKWMQEQMEKLKDFDTWKEWKNS